MTKYCETCGVVLPATATGSHCDPLPEMRITDTFCEGDVFGVQHDEGYTTVRRCEIGRIVTTLRAAWWDKDNEVEVHLTDGRVLSLSGGGWAEILEPSQDVIDECCRTNRRPKDGRAPVTFADLVADLKGQR